MRREDRRFWIRIALSSVVINAPIALSMAVFGMPIWLGFAFAGLAGTSTLAIWEGTRRPRTSDGRPVAAVVRQAGTTQTAAPTSVVSPSSSVAEDSAPSSIPA
jgi:hypothetical protein